MITTVANVVTHKLLDRTAMTPCVCRSGINAPYLRLSLRWLKHVRPFEVVNVQEVQEGQAFRALPSRMNQGGENFYLRILECGVP